MQSLVLIDNLLSFSSTILAVGEAYLLLRTDPRVWLTDCGTRMLKIHLGRTQVLEYGQTTSENSPLEVNILLAGQR